MLQGQRPPSRKGDTRDGMGVHEGVGVGMTAALQSRRWRMEGALEQDQRRMQGPVRGLSIAWFSSSTPGCQPTSAYSSSTAKDIDPNKCATLRLLLSPISTAAR
jgi:hypothetical protein